MVAKLKSDVTQRDERGLFGLTMVRILGAGMSGGFGYLFLPKLLPLPGWTGFLFLIGFATLYILATGDIAGVPRWKYLYISLSGRMIVSAHEAGDDSLYATICRFFDWDYDAVVVEASDLFEAADYSDDTSWMEFRFRGKVLDEDESMGVSDDLDSLVDLDLDSRSLHDFTDSDSST